MESVGTRLKRLRLQKGISLEEVSKKTKIHLNILKGIEEDSLTNLSPIYLKGFLKIYCQFLGANLQDFIPDYREPQDFPRTVPFAREKSPSFFKAALLKLGSFGTKIKIARIFIYFLIFIFLSIGLFKLGKFVASRRASSRRKSELSATLRKSTYKTQTTKTEKKDTTTVLPKPVPLEFTTKSDLQSGIRLAIQAKEDCWVQLKADGRVIFQNVLKKGRSETWQAKDKIEFSLSNAGVVVLEVNGKLISSLGRKGQAVKNIIITKDGLTVGK